MSETSSEKKHFEDRIPADVRDHLRAAREEFRESVKSIFPPEFIEHRRKARKEMLLAFRSVIDSALQHMEKQDKKPA